MIYKKNPISIKSVALPEPMLTNMSEVVVV